MFSHEMIHRPEVDLHFLMLKNLCTKNYSCTIRIKLINFSINRDLRTGLAKAILSKILKVI
jgi:hypothetical protein